MHLHQRSWLSLDNCSLIGWNQKKPAEIPVRMKMFIQTGIPAVNDTLELVQQAPLNGIPFGISAGIRVSGAAA